MLRALKPAVAGFDYTHFGSDKKTADDLKDYFDGEIIIVLCWGWKESGSTRIRQTILDGDVRSWSFAQHSSIVTWNDSWGVDGLSVTQQQLSF